MPKSGTRSSRGALAPGTELTLRGLADAVGTSLMPVRDSLRRLVSEGGLELLPSRKFIRQVLEGEAVALTARQMSQEQLAAAWAIFARLETVEATDSRQGWILDRPCICAYTRRRAGPACLRSSSRSDLSLAHCWRVYRRCGGTAWIRIGCCWRRFSGAIGNEPTRPFSAICPTAWPGRRQCSRGGPHNGK